ncbi:MAG TPA: cyclic nucleotide-binding domain-containing protein, partial [Spirochaetia bacterium]|nr:cyclic nucleotide-binding domain-containing protein [Spirochaetia bacterium]
MSPKAVQYRANSIIYFKGDQSERIFLLNSGKVSLSYIDIETGQEVRDLIKVGEFFGVKSALGRYIREETAVVLQDAAAMVF